MADESFAKVREVFDAAYEMPPEDRPAYLNRACGDDPELRRRVETVLAAAEEEHPFLSEPTAAHAAEGAPASDAEATPSEATGSTIGRYTLLEQIGEGGFGTVFMAEQEQPVRRRVALKIIKAGMDTRQVIARFEAERQALAMMDHPGIARVLDAGATASGRPYFVMELVRGEPITEYCDQSELTTRERLDLFTQVCHAVQHAHQKGIIHRDIKPSNVLVTVVDGEPAPKVIDFGIAKATESKLTELTMFTEHRALIGTPAYMSPEQAALSGVNVDTRSDIYSLGVLLYELLTGTTPFDTKELLAAGLAEIQRIIREVDPEKPSTRLSMLKQTPPANAPRTKDAGRLSSIVRGDLDWIVMKAMDKERSRRYETASGLAADVERYLDGETVEAAPPSRSYRMRKFIRRHRVGVTAASLVVLSLAAGVVGTTIGLVRAEDRRREAVRAQAETQRVSDFQAAMLTGINAASMGRRIKELLREQVGAALERRQIGTFPDRRPPSPDEIEAELAAFDGLVGAAHAADVARGVIDEFVLGSATDSIDAEFAGEPLVRAQLHQAVSAAYERLGLYDLAASHLVSALKAGRLEPGKADELVASCLRGLAGLRLDQAKYAAAKPLLVEALDMNRRLYGEESLPVASCIDMLGRVIWRTDDVEAERLLREALAIRRAHGAEAITIATSLNDLAELLKERKDYDESVPLFTEALTLARGEHDQHPVLARILHNLGQLYTHRGDFDAAEPLLLEALAMQRELLGDMHPDVAISLIDLGVLHKRRGDLDKAKARFYEALSTFRAIHGDTHPSVAQTLGRLVRLLWAERDLEAAEPLARERLAINRALLPDDHPAIAKCLNELALLRKRQDNPEEAERLYLEALDIQREQLGDHPHVAATLYNLARLHGDTGDPQAAEPYLREALMISRKVYPREHPRTATYLHHLGDVLLALDRHEEAEQLVQESVAMYASHPEWPALSEHTHALSILTEIYIAEGRTEEAAAVNREGLEVRRRLPRGSLELASSLNTAARLYGRVEHFADAKPLYRECLTIYSSLFPDGHARGWNKYQVMCYLGDALAHQAAELRDADPTRSQEFLEEAEPLLLDGYNGMKNEPALANSRGEERKREALASIVRLYETWDSLSPDSGRAEQAARWRAELEKLPPP